MARRTREKAPRRRTELGLILGALVITGAAYTVASLGRSSTIPADVGPFLGAVLGLMVLAHLATRAVARDADSTFLPIAAVLNGLGYVVIARLDTDLAARQAGWTAVGIVAYIATLVAVPSTKVLARSRYTVGLVAVALVILPLVPVIGHEVRGARIWVRVASFTLQPGEFAKVALAVFFAAYLAERRRGLAVSTARLGPIPVPEPRFLLPLGGLVGVCVLVMMFERDLGSALLLFVLVLTLVWVATGRAVYLVLGLGMFSAGAFAAWRMFSHLQTRVDIWLDPWADPSGDGFQIVQSTFAMAWGGVGGTGLGLGVGAGRIPFDESDFIFAILGEELGLIGTTAILAAFLLFVGSGLRVANVTEDPFRKLLAVGLSTAVGMQTVIILGGITGLLPLTGVTLPFVSYGGSSLIANYVVIALLVRLSDEHNRSQIVRAERAQRPAEVLS